MTFEWDEEKNLSNFRKHGVWFEEAQTVWADASSSEFFDPEHSESESPGSSELATLAFTACCWWSFVSDRMATSSA